MDVVLEVFDTFLFDPLYAAIFPSSPANGIYSQFPLNSFTTGAKNASTATYSSLKESATPVYNGWTYEPATQYFSIEPGKSAYLSSWERDYWGRQAVSLFLITWLFGIVVYFVCAGLSYVFVFDKRTINHPKYLKNQMWLEINQSLQSFPGMALCTLPFFLTEVRGWSKMYDRTEDGPGLWYNYFQFPLFLLFTDYFIYWIHRGLHHPRIYKHLHKKHHKWIMPTPFASHAFHPIDGFSQSLPYHIFPFIFPLQKFAYVILFVFINVWTVMIHDGEYVADSPIINGAACHAIHHAKFDYNYGQYTTLWDRVYKSYRRPDPEMYQKELMMSQARWEKDVREVDAVVKAVEGSDDRTYIAEDSKKDQ